MFCLIIENIRMFCWWILPDKITEGWMFCSSKFCNDCKILSTCWCIFMCFIVLERCLPWGLCFESWCLGCRMQPNSGVIWWISNGVRARSSRKLCASLRVTSWSHTVSVFHEPLHGVLDPVDWWSDRQTNWTGSTLLAVQPISFCCNHLVHNCC